jgi:hypothetical protein
MQLKEYWAFVMSADGHAIDLFGLHCETEEQAKERARQLVTDSPMELWDGPRRVARFDPKHGPSPGESLCANVNRPK